MLDNVDLHEDAIFAQGERFDDVGSHFPNRATTSSNFQMRLGVCTNIWCQGCIVPTIARMAKIVLDLDRGDISVDDFTEMFSAQVKLVREVMIEMGIAANEVRWVVADLKYGSTYAAATPQILGKNAFMADVEQAIANAGAGLDRLGTASERPKFFNDEALKLSRTLAGLVSQSNVGKAQLVFGNKAVVPSQHLGAHVNEIIRGDLQSIGSIEGQLIGVQGSDGVYKISIHDRLRNRKVPCNIPPELLKRALNAFEARVIVRGEDLVSKGRITSENRRASLRGDAD